MKGEREREEGNDLERMLSLIPKIPENKSKAWNEGSSWRDITSNDAKKKNTCKPLFMNSIQCLWTAYNESSKQTHWYNYSNKK